MCDLFRIHVISAKDIRSPILTLGSTSFYHIKHENVYIVAISKTNANVALVFEFLYKFVALGKNYFGALNEDSIKNNFSLIYELTDEICDFGIPQNTEAETLKMLVNYSEELATKANEVVASKIAIQATGAVSWRRPDIVHKRNEAFLDVVEQVNLLMSAQGTILREDVSAAILMRTFLSGMPECRIGLNDKLLLEKTNKKGGTATDKETVQLDDFQFHQCVRLSSFEADRTVIFIPPDGDFELMKYSSAYVRYRSTSNIQLPFKVTPNVVEVGTASVDYQISLRATFPERLHAQNILVKIPVPLNAHRADVSVTLGKAKYVGSENCIVWKYN